MLHGSDSWKLHSKDNYRAMWGGWGVVGMGGGGWGGKAGGVKRGRHWMSMATIPFLSVHLSQRDLRMHDFRKCLPPARFQKVSVPLKT